MNTLILPTAPLSPAFVFFFSLPNPFLNLHLLFFSLYFKKEKTRLAIGEKTYTRSIRAQIKSQVKQNNPSPPAPPNRNTCLDLPSPFLPRFLPLKKGIHESRPTSGVVIPPEKKGNGREKKERKLLYMRPLSRGRSFDFSIGFAGSATAAALWTLDGEVLEEFWVRADFFLDLGRRKKRSINRRKWVSVCQTSWEGMEALENL